MQRREYVKTVGSIAAGSSVLLAGCSGETERESGDGGGGGSGDDTRLEIVSHEAFVTEYDSVGVRGVAENTTDEEISYAQIEVYFLSGNSRVGSGLANINNLASGRQWEFEAICFDCNPNDVDSYEIAVTAEF